MEAPNPHIDLRLAGVYAKIERAREHGKSLWEEFRAFMTPQNCEASADIQSDGPIKLTLRFKKQIPTRVATVLGDAIHNLRCALDHLACAAAALNGVGPEGIGFPIGRSHAAFKEAAAKDLKGVPIEFFQVIEKFEPYKGGNESLYILNQLDRVDKHRLLLPTIVVAKKMFARFYVGEPGPNCQYVGPPVFEISQDIFPALEPDNTIIEAIIFRGPKLPPEACLHFRPTFNIRFDKGTVASGHEILSTLSEMGNQVLGVVNAVNNAIFVAR